MQRDDTHGLTHFRFTDGRLTPGCVCGWWSQNREHAEYEAHIRKVRNGETA
jgi:hypothetical protein